VSGDASQNIRDRTFAFGCDVARFALGLAPRPGVGCVVDQLLKAGTPVGANLEEAKGASSKREFLKYAQIALREAREAVYWLRLCSALQLGHGNDLRVLRDEGDQIARILATIVLNTKRGMMPRST